MKNMYEVGLLLDFYGQLLTSRQQEILDLHFNYDYSLGEIAQQLGISRQGVYDNIKKGKALLNGFEDKLGLVSKFSCQKKKADEVLNILQTINIDKLDETTKALIKNIEKGIMDIIEEV